LLESFNALKTAGNIDPPTAALPPACLQGRDDFFAAESPYALPLLPIAALVTLPSCA